MQAITTKYLGPTNTQNGRIKATGWRGSITVPYDRSLPHGRQAHRPAVEALLDKWEQEDKNNNPGRFEVVAVGAMPKQGDSYAFIVE